MIDDALRTQLQHVLALVREPLRLIATVDEGPASTDMLALLRAVTEHSGGKVSLDVSGSAVRRPSFVIAREGHSDGVSFAGAPLGHEFTSLVLALLWTSGHPPKVERGLIEAVAAIDQPLEFEVYMSLSCQNCPDVVQALSLMAILNPKVRTAVIEGATFQAEVEERSVMAVPMIYLNGKPFGSGRMTLDEIVARLDPRATRASTRSLSSRAPYDVLVVGGGPAGAAAAVYAARKGLNGGACQSLRCRYHESAACQTACACSYSRCDDRCRARRRRHTSVKKCGAGDRCACQHRQAISWARGTG